MTVRPDSDQHGPGQMLEVPRHHLRQVVAGATGNALEWYDFASYGYFGAIFGRNFFPSDTPYISLLSAFAVFAAAFFMRPIGGILFGHVGDRLGTNRALLLSAGLMTASTVAIGCLPTYATAGVAAPVLLVLLRLGQGLSVGGEYISSAVFLVERSEPGRRGLLGSLAPVGVVGGVLGGSLTGVVVSELLPPAEVQEWGWRIPFLLGIGLGLFVIVLRGVAQANDLQSTRQSAGRLPLNEAFRSERRPMLLAFTTTLAVAASFYLVFVYLVTALQTESGVGQHTAFVINTASTVIMLVSLPLSGMLSDRFGRRSIMIVLFATMMILSLPLFALIAGHQPVWIMLGQMVFGLLIGGLSGVLPSMLVETFGSSARNTAMAISYNAAFALAGGTAPMVATALLARTHDLMSLGYYIAGLSAVSLMGAFVLKDRAGQPLD